MATSAPALTSLRFGALGTEVLVVSRAEESHGWNVRALVAEYESRFSRFLPDSELQELCRASGAEVTVSEDLFEILGLALRYWHDTGGIFDPLIRPELESAGYDRTFGEVAATSDGPPALPRPQRAAFGEVQLDATRRAVRLPAGSSLDLGGIGKGWILDRVGALLASAGPFLVDMGGDMVARGNGPNCGPGWLIAVADPVAPERDLCWLHLLDQAIATSTTTRRRWRRGQRWLHHIIDPRTGAPAETDVVQATAVALTAVEADIYAKTALILGSEAGLAYVEERRVPALLVTTNGTQVTESWRRLGAPMMAY